jgi:hypothetical protein
MEKLNFSLLGCGFLTTHIVPHLLPYANSFTLIDRERLEKVNYDNSIFLKNYSNKRKVTALASYIQLLSSTSVTPIHQDIKSEADLLRLKTDFIICTFDNIKSRMIARNFAVANYIPAIFVGVTENYIYIDWANNIVFPKTEEAIKKAEDDMAKVRDVCTRLEFRKLGVIAAGYTYYAIENWILHKHRYRFVIETKNGISVSMLCDIKEK